MIQSTSAISNTCYLEFLLSQTFSLVPSAHSVTNYPYKFVRHLEPHVSTFHYSELFSRSLQRFLGLFSICYIERFHFTHSNAGRTHSKTLVECLSFLNLTQQHVGQTKAWSQTFRQEEMQCFERLVYLTKLLKITVTYRIYFSLLLPLNYLPLVSQCTKYSISFTLLLNLWKVKILDFFRSL